MKQGKQRKSATPPKRKKPYTPPRLIVHGTLEEITRGTGPSTLDRAGKFITSICCPG